MTERNWTPGPWHATTYNLGEFDVTAKMSDAPWSGTLCTRSQWKGNANQSNANAHLIAAAPDLYAALEEVLNQYDELSLSHGEPKRMADAYFSARKALAKARGEA